jgi:hypothetical protein
MVAVFGYANMGKVYGFCNVVAAMCSIFNNMVRLPVIRHEITHRHRHRTSKRAQTLFMRSLTLKQILEWVFDRAEGSFREVNGVFMCLQLLQFAFVR